MENNPPTSRAHSRRPVAATKQAADLARALAKGTLFAAGMAAAHASGPEMDARFHLFDPTLVDRLQAPITRHHE
jgi:hypothetical protein